MTLLYWLYCFSAVSIASGFAPATYPAQILAECSTGELLMGKELIKTLEQFQQQLGPPGCNPPRNRSCQNILYCFPSAPSGYYQITAPNCLPVQVYCDMERINCGGEGGWTRVAYVNMSQSGTNCPQGLTQRNFTGKRLLWQEYNWMSKHCLPYSWSQLLSCVWTAKRISVWWHPRCIQCRHYWKIHISW